MTKQEAWVRFMAGVLASGHWGAVGAARIADKALDEYVKRWPETAGDDPMVRAEEGGKEGT